MINAYEIKDKEKQSDIFNMFHDGYLINLKKKGSFVEFVIEIIYLAEIINKNYTQFYGHLHNCTQLSFLGNFSRGLRHLYQFLYQFVVIFAIFRVGSPTGRRCWPVMAYPSGHRATR